MFDVHHYWGDVKNAADEQEQPESKLNSIAVDVFAELIMC